MRAMRRVGVALILVSLLAVGCGSSSNGGTITSTAPGDNTAKIIHGFRSATDRRRGESFAIQQAVRSEKGIARRLHHGEVPQPTQCAESAEVTSATRFSCVVRFQMRDGSADSHTVTVALDPQTGAISKAHEVIDLETTFNIAGGAKVRLKK